ncbi:MAG: hypothetical protein WCJ37_18315 [Syntrophus sp. (in: bacteria)]
MMVAKSLAKKVHIQQACAVLNLPRSSYYRWQDRTKECRYVIIDIFIRYALGWMIATRKLAVLGKMLIEQSGEKQGVKHNQPFKRESYRLKQLLMEKEKRV